MFTIDESGKKLRADIRVLGIGGGGGNAIETMQKAGINGVKFIAVNTDAQTLAASEVEKKIQLGANLTKGLGAGANPEVGRRAAIESYEDIAKSLKGADMVFITAGMGGGTGTGGISVVAEAAKEQGALTVAVVTYPFLFEGRKRRRQAQKGIGDLKKYVDTLIVIHNDKLLSLSNDKTPLSETFKKTDDILFQAVKGIAELISVKGLINLDFADVKTVMHNKGMALMGVGIGEGKTRVVDAVSRAISSPLLENTSIKGATGIIVNITGSCDLSLTEVNQAISLLTEEADPDAEIIVGAVIDDSKQDSLSLTVIATGFDEENPYLLEEEPHKRIQWSHKPFMQNQFVESKMELPANENETVALEVESSPSYPKTKKPSYEIKSLSSETTPESHQEPETLENTIEETIETESSDITDTAVSPQSEPSSFMDPKTSLSENEDSIQNPSSEDPVKRTKQENILAAKSQSVSSAEEEPKDLLKNSRKKNSLTPREILLSKVKEYKQRQEISKQNKKSGEEIKQTSLSLGEDTSGEALSDNDSLLFETEVGLSPEDIG